MPTDSFWAGVGQSIQHASGDIVIAAVIVCAIIFAYVKFYLPERIKDKSDQRDFEMQKFQLEKHRQESEIELQRQRGENQVRQIEILNNQTEILRNVLSILQSVDTSNKVIMSQLEDSKTNSRAMGKVIELVQDDIQDVKRMVSDLHDITFSDAKIGGSD